jgi:hypothetical protein
MAGPTIFIWTPSAEQTIGCPSGNIYASDIYQLIYNANVIDVAFLIAIGCYVLNQRNNVSDSSPTADNDYTQLFGAGSLWYNTDTESLYICVSAGVTPGNAVWVAISSGTTIGLATTIHTNETIDHPYTTVYVDNTSSAPITVTLKSDYSTNSNVAFIDTGNNFGTYPCTITPSSGTIRGLASFALVTSGQKETFNFDGTNWW